ncbi:zinc ribbon domain-containing protein [Zooshikella marina]|uniref:zinc ribbon domain-containing protein n=1 Tax=Zooshikella ganghwensis TaxID=202772 RepID=UPI001BB04FB0|nr:zinc ribbon domain-containing protein [Zooshikella ganghwensis]MBU2709009.1 zinc ribbon domain-containing protein [Zooshikella ganghwensis]
MPTYDYRCPSNGQVVEVFHGMNEEILTWGALCQLAGVSPGDTDVNAKVIKLATGGNVVSSQAYRTNEPPCATGKPCCGGGSCEFSG